MLCRIFEHFRHIFSPFSKLYNFFFYVEIWEVCWAKFLSFLNYILPRLFLSCLFYSFCLEKCAFFEFKIVNLGKQAKWNYFFSSEKFEWCRFFLTPGCPKSFKIERVMIVQTYWWWENGRCFLFFTESAFVNEKIRTILHFYHHQSMCIWKITTLSILKPLIQIMIWKKIFTLFILKQMM